jgi:hypothetical protein
MPISFPRVPAVLTVALFCVTGCSEGDRVLIEETRPRFAEEKDPMFGATARERFLANNGMGRGGDQTTGQGDGEVKNPFRWETPEGWTELKATQMRVINFQFGADGEGQCYLTALSGGGGGMVANVNRWRGQMGLDPLPDEEMAALEERTLLGAPAKYVDIEGDFGGMSFPGAPAADSKKDYRLIGLIQVQDPFTFFIKMTGPKALVAEHEPAFRRFCESIKIGEH